MDITEIAKKLGLADNKPVVHKASEFRRLSDVKFDSSAIGVGEICKAIICLEIAANKYEVIFDRQIAIRLSGMSEKAYNRSFNHLQNVLDVKNNLDVRELAIQFGCVRIIPFVQKGLKLYKQRFFESLPSSRRGGIDFSRPVFMAVAFYLCAKKHKLKADKIKLIELCGTSESEFSSVSNSMKDLCHDVFGVLKEKKDPKEVKGNRELLDAFPEKRGYEDGGYMSDEEKEPSSYKKRKLMDKLAYEEWKSTVVSSIGKEKDKDATTMKRAKQARLTFPTVARDSQNLEVNVILHFQGLLRVCNINPYECYDVYGPVCSHISTFHHHSTPLVVFCGPPEACFGPELWVSPLRLVPLVNFGLSPCSFLIPNLDLFFLVHMNLLLMMDSSSALLLNPKNYIYFLRKKKE